MSVLFMLLLLFQWSLQDKVPTPVDVTPIQEEYGELGYQFCDMGCVWVSADHPIDGETKPTRRTRPTCADKTRFLMTSEDGAKHCIRLN